MDPEVCALTHDDGESSSTTNSDVGSDVELTAESVATFMKKVNRIRSCLSPVPFHSGSFITYHLF